MPKTASVLAPVLGGTALVLGIAYGVTMQNFRNDEVAALPTEGEGFGAQMTTAYSLGAMVGHLDAGGEHRALADEVNGRLVDDVARSEHPRVLRHRLTALGSTKRASNLSVFEGYLDHDDPQVRAAAVRAVGLSGEGTPALLRMVGDDDRLVQRAALEALPATAEVLSALVPRLEADELDPFNASPVIVLAQRGLSPHHDLAVGLLEALIAHVDLQARDKNAAYALLGSG